MKFKELTEKNKEYIKNVYLDKNKTWDDRMSTLCAYLKKSERTIRKWLVALGYKSKENIESVEYKSAQKKKLNKSKDKFLISWAQNNTSVHNNFLLNMEAYAKHLGADIHVIAGKYNVMKLEENEDESKITWDDKLNQYLDANRHDVHKYLSIMSDVKISPTAITPLTGMRGFGGEGSCIFGHPKVQLEVVPRLVGDTPKMCLTTGACTVKNYSESKAGKKGEFHHQLGFVIVEIKDKHTFFIRQVTAEDDGSFTDLYYDVRNTKVTKIDEVEAIVLGDLHFGQHDELVLENTFKLMHNLKPKHVVLHDIFDGYSISHHDMKNAFKQFGKEVNGKNNLKDEVEVVMTGLKPFEKYENVAIVRSNHDEHLDRFLTDNDWRKLPTTKNSLAYMEYSQMLLNQHAKDNVIGVIPELVNKRYPKYKTLGLNDSYKVKGWELGQHGDIGANGARGAINGFVNLNTKMVVGHSHTPSRRDGVSYVGTSTKLRLSYNKGASSWLNAHVIIHKSSKLQHIFFIGKNREFTTL